MGGEKSESVEAGRGHYGLHYTAAEAPVTQFLYSHIQTRKQHILMQQREREMVKAGSKLRIFYELCQVKTTFSCSCVSGVLHISTQNCSCVVTPGYEWEPALHCSHENI